MSSGKNAKSKNKSTAKKAEEDAAFRLVTVYIMGKPYKVPAEATIMGAIEYAGQQIIRGAGCREGFCGACGAIFRLPGDYKIYSGLACTTVVQEGMTLTQIPAFPVQKAVYDLEKLEPNAATFQKVYPVVFRCVSCNTCTKVCPQGLQVMDYVNAAMRGDVEAVMDLSFDCVCCGLCAMRCPAEIVQHKVGILGKRLYGRYLRKHSPELAERVKQIEAGVFDKEFSQLMAMSKEKLKKAYYDRDME